MAVEKKRILYLFYLLTKAEGNCIRSSTLAEQVGVSERTIKADKKDLQDFALASGTALNSQKGKGYWLDILDESLYIPVCEQLQIRFMYQNEMEPGLKETRTNDILRRLIAEDHFVKLDDVVEELYLTRSSIQEEMKQVRSILKGFNLDLVTKPGLGVHIEGKELDLRLCMLRLFEFHYHKALPLFKRNRYLDFFECEEEERYNIRKTFLQVLRNSRFHFMDEYTQRFGRYMILARHRYHQGYQTYFTQEEIIFLKKFPMYDLSVQIFKAMEVYGGYEMDESEILALEVILLGWMDLDSDSDLDQDFKEISTQARKLNRSICLEIKKEVGLDFYEIENCENIMITGLIPILFQNHFQIEQNDFGDNVFAYDQVLTSPLSVYLGYCAKKTVDRKCHSDIATFSHLLLANRIYFLINKVHYDYVPIRALLCSRNGIEAAKSIRDEILNRLHHRFFEKIDLFELYEMRGIPTEDYDVAIVCFPYFSYKYDWPYLLMDLIPTRKQMNDIFNIAVLNGVQLAPLLQALNFNKDFVFRQFKYESMESFIKLISFKIGKGSEEINRIEKDLLGMASTCVYLKTCILFVPNQTGRNHFSVYHLDKPGLWGSKEVDTIMVFSVYFNKNWQQARFIEHVTHECIINSESIYLLTESEQVSPMIDLVKKCIKTTVASLV